MGKSPTPPTPWYTPTIFASEKKKEREMIDKLIADGALFLISHSAGKDSQAMYIHLRDRIPLAQQLVIHGVLPGVEWEGVVEHILATIRDPREVKFAPESVKRWSAKGRAAYPSAYRPHPDGTNFLLAFARSTMFSMVERRQAWPSATTRNCTSDLKRGPILREAKRYAADNGYSVLVNATGRRAQESRAREVGLGGTPEKPVVFQFMDRESTVQTQIYDWLPIFDWSVERVWKTIHDAGEKGHWAYEAGMSRLSCVFCILANKDDLRNAAQLQPEMYARYVAVEEEISHTVKAKKVKGKTVPVPLEEFTGVKANPRLLAWQRLQVEEMGVSITRHRDTSLSTEDWAAAKFEAMRYRVAAMVARRTGSKEKRVESVIDRYDDLLIGRLTSMIAEGLANREAPPPTPRAPFVRIRLEWRKGKGMVRTVDRTLPGHRTPVLFLRTPEKALKLWCDWAKAQGGRAVQLTASFVYPPLPDGVRQERVIFDWNEGSPWTTPLGFFYVSVGYYSKAERSAKRKRYRHSRAAPDVDVSPLLQDSVDLPTIDDPKAQLALWTAYVEAHNGELDQLIVDRVSPSTDPSPRARQRELTWERGGKLTLRGAS